MSLGDKHDAALRNTIMNPRRSLLRAVAALALLCCAANAQVVTNSVFLISTRGTNLLSLAGAARDCFASAVTPDGRWVVFVSAANNLVSSPAGGSLPEAYPPAVNVYLRDLSNAVTILVSAGMSGWTGSSSDCSPAQVSHDGRFVVFESAATNLVPGAWNGLQQVFVRDVQQQQTLLVSASTNGGPANAPCHSPVLSADGRFVAFVSEAANLVPGDTNGVADVFVRDLEKQSTVLISAGAVSAGISGTKWSRSEQPKITPNGRYVTFYSTATNLVPEGPVSDGFRLGDIYLHDLSTRTTIWVSREARAQSLLVLGTKNVHSFNHVTSDDGQWVSFQSAVPGATTGAVYRFHVPTQSTELVHSNAAVAPGVYAEISDLAATPDGGVLAFAAPLPVDVATNATAIFVWNATTKSNALVTVNASGQPAIGISRPPALDATGTQVLFISNAEGLTTNAVTPGYNLYRRDLQANSTVLLNVSGTGELMTLAGSDVPLLSTNAGVTVFNAIDRQASGTVGTIHQVFARQEGSGVPTLISPHAEALPSLVSETGSGLTPLSVSSNGLRVAFVSYASDLVPQDTNGFPDIFIRDQETGATVAASVNTNAVTGNKLALGPALSADGRFLAFVSSASDMTPGDVNAATDVFLRDLTTGSNSLISARIIDGKPGNGASFGSQLSRDGTKLVFQTYSTGMATTSSYAPASSGGYPDVVHVDLTTKKRLSLGPKYGVLFAPALSPDGRYVALVEATSSFPSGGPLAVWDTLTGRKVLQTSNNFLAVATSDLAALALSPSGEHLVYATNTTTGGAISYFRIPDSSPHVIARHRVTRNNRLAFNSSGNLMAYSGLDPSSIDSASQIYLYSFSAGTNLLVSRAEMGLANTVNDRPDLSPDGNLVAFRSSTRSSAAGTTSEITSLLVYVRETDSILSLSQGLGRHLGAPIFSGDGQTLLFPSRLGNSTLGDFNDASDIIAVKISRTGSIPVFYAALTPSALGWLLSWPVQTNRFYAVEYKHLLSDPAWIELTEPIVIEGTQGRLLDPAVSEQRFYRIVAR